MFVHHMFAADTELGAALPGTSGLMQFLQEQRNLTVELVQEVWQGDSANTPASGDEGRGTTRWKRRVCGTAVLPLQQFKSSFVVKLDIFAPVGVTMGSICLKVSKAPAARRGAAQARAVCHAVLCSRCMH